MFDFKGFLNAIGGIQAFEQKVATMANNFSRMGGMSPEQIGQQLLKSGKMSQSQFQEFAAIADKLTGGRR